MAGSVLVCGLISASTLAAWLNLAHAQQGLAHRLWSLQALRAAEAVLRDAQSLGSDWGAAPGQGCNQGLCAWQGTNGLTRAHWQNQLDQAAWGATREQAVALYRQGTRWAVAVRARKARGEKK